MNEMDLDTQSIQDESEPQVRLPWESIDPPVQKKVISPPTSTDHHVEAVVTYPVSKRLASLDEDERDTEVTPDGDEWLATHAFFPDEIIEPVEIASEPVLDQVSQEIPETVATMAVELPASDASIEVTDESELIEASIDLDPATIDETPWDTIDEIESPLPEIDPAPVPESVAAAEIEQPVEPATEEKISEITSSATDVVPESAITLSTNESILAAASELAEMASTFAPIDIDEPMAATIAVSASELQTTGVFVVPTPQAAVEIEEPVEEPETETEFSEPTATTTGGGWTIPLMCVGIGLIACCMVIPQGESNRQLRYEQAVLSMDLQHVQKQVAVNNEFLTKVMDDPTLAERLAGRQMKTVRKGQKVVPLNDTAASTDMSPFSLVAVAPPPELPPYQPARGTIADICNNARSRLYLLGMALAMVAVGLVMGFSPKASD